jgi:hypothetical protein
VPGCCPPSGVAKRRTGSLSPVSRCQCPRCQQGPETGCGYLGCASGQALPEACTVSEAHIVAAGRSHLSRRAHATQSGPLCASSSSMRGSCSRRSTSCSGSVSTATVSCRRAAPHPMCTAVRRPPRQPGFAAFVTSAGCLRGTAVSMRSCRLALLHLHAWSRRITQRCAISLAAAKSGAAAGSQARTSARASPWRHERSRRPLRCVRAGAAAVPRAGSGGLQEVQQALRHGHEAEPPAAATRAHGRRQDTAHGRAARQVRRRCAPLAGCCGCRLAARACSKLVWSAPGGRNSVRLTFGSCASACRTHLARRRRSGHVHAPGAARARAGCAAWASSRPRRASR